MNLTASDRKALIRLASSLPKGTEERRTILKAVGRMAAARLPEPYGQKFDSVVRSLNMKPSRKHPGMEGADGDYLIRPKGKNRFEVIISAFPHWIETSDEANDWRESNGDLVDLVIERLQRAGLKRKMSNQQTDADFSIKMDEESWTYLIFSNPDNPPKKFATRELEVYGGRRYNEAPRAQHIEGLRTRLENLYATKPVADPNQAAKDAEAAKKEWGARGGWGEYYFATVVGLVRWQTGGYSGLVQRQFSGS